MATLTVCKHQISLIYQKKILSIYSDQRALQREEDLDFFDVDENIFLYAVALVTANIKSNSFV